jgi:hypothetical protein
MFGCFNNFFTGQDIMTDNRVEVELELDEDLQFQLMCMAHERDITLNQLIENILREFIEANPLRWTIPVETDSESGDAIITFPESLLRHTGWQEGDTIDWVDRGDGSWELRKI